ncbi:unnamed protein product [Ambrosiozyma monospora]|uniref:Unnamed protein product n=1 Tax=Ambrosiozyma monospora TaxID=43982 RepID=A0A9W6T1X4_AMBMO|nr:unnamed protein product [Ambrosiozyma monospora]
MIVSFKLETDNSILIKKAQDALKRYNHQLVIGNLLQTRKHEVVFVTENDQSWIKLTEEQIKNAVDIESLIIPSVLKAHSAWIEERKLECL